MNISSFTKAMKGIRGDLWKVIKPTKHGSRHRKSQMKAFGRGRFTGRSSRFGL